MHESHQVQRLIQEARQMAAERKASKVKKVTIVVGELLGFDEMSVRLHWEEFAIGTPLADAELEIRFVPARLRCPKCSALFPKKGSDLSCPTCKIMGSPTDTGREFLIEDMAV
ncbi:MAG: hydrogenase maturation nickel metallochaperone HypA [Candidatus Omnitrophica bacterium]|nr:hydrogenase maturation nickel metallochaperone HypA [Candidatus Omnitrophota bacterium]